MMKKKKLLNWKTSNQNKTTTMKTSNQGKPKPNLIPKKIALSVRVTHTALIIINHRFDRWIILNFNFSPTILISHIIILSSHHNQNTARTAFGRVEALLL
jgi:hypothetical protein